MNWKIIKNFLTFCLISFLASFSTFAVVQSTQSTIQKDSIEELKTLINEKNEELKEILKQREVLEKELEKTNKQSTALQREVNTINHNINQLNLSIKANQLVLDKLELEINSIEKDIEQAEDSIGKIKETIAKLFVKLQQHDNENLLIILLRNQSLAESVSEKQTITNLNNSLLFEINKLIAIKTNFSNKLEELNNKKQERQIEKLNLTNRQAILAEQQSSKQKFLVFTKNQEKIYQQQIAELDKKQEEISAVIEKIEHELRASFDPSLLPLKRPGLFGFPVERIIITQEYGPTAFAQYAYRSKFHNGIDFGARIGTPVFAALEGIVKWVDNNDKGTSRWTRYQYGKYILIEHKNNLTTLYAHLSRFAVQKGQAVKKGDLIGYSGDTGYSYGPHIHFTVYWSSSVQLKSIPPAAGLVPIGVTVNPFDYLPKI